MGYELVKAFTIADIIESSDDRDCSRLWEYIRAFMRFFNITHYDFRDVGVYINTGCTPFYKNITDTKFLAWIDGLDKDAEQFLIEKGFIRKKEEKTYKLGSVWRHDSGGIYILSVSGGCEGRSMLISLCGKDTSRVFNRGMGKTDCFIPKHFSEYKYTGYDNIVDYVKEEM